MLVQVAIDLALDRLFTYEVPAALEGKLAVGQLLSVPFGHRSARGFAMRVGERGMANGERGMGNGGYKLKPVDSIVDETPFFSKALLELVKQIAAYTASPIETVLRAAIPAAVIKPGARAKAQYYVEADEDASEQALKSATKRQLWLREQLVRVGGGWLSQVCTEFGTTPATLRQMASAGLVVVESRTRRRDPFSRARIVPSSPLELNAEQSAALEAIGALSPGKEGAKHVVLLNGVTGSGKTEVYLQAIARELDAGRGAIVLVPEISLTPQTVQRFASRFGNRVAVLHSALSDGERYDEWHRIRSGEARVVIGPRSAVFAPVSNLGLIVVDEEHESSYKQEEAPRYHARDVAVLRGFVEGARVVLGSATPSLESWANVARGKYAYAAMRQRAGAGRLPSIAIVPMMPSSALDASGASGSGGLFSRELMDCMAARLDRHEQTILFLNRRGYSRSVDCMDCGESIMCPDCSVAYTYHQADSCLRCHICGGWIPVPQACPSCRSRRLTFKGIGTQRVESALSKCFPHARILRMDADSTSRKNSHDDILGAFRRFEADILLGTQMIAKGLDFPNVTLVGVLNADSSLNMPDFRAAERTYQLLSQVAGRAGRASLPGEVIIQTYDPDAFAIRAAAKGDFVAFAREELKARKEANFPPYCHLAAVSVRAKDAGIASKWAQMYAQSLAAYAKKDARLEVGEAWPSALEKAEGWYRWQIVLRAPASSVAVRAWRWLMSVRPPHKDVRASIDVDAYSLT